MKRSILALILLALAAPAWADKSVDDDLAKAVEQIRKGKPDDAVKTMQKAATQANSADGYIALAFVQRRVAQRAEAAGSIRKAVEVATVPADKAMALAALSTLALSEGTGADALARAQQAVAAQETAVSLAALARAQARTEDIPAALATIGKVVGGTGAGVHAARGEVLMAAGQAKEAAEAYRQALAADAKLVPARAGLATALSAQGQHAEAVREARAATDADGNSEDAHTALATALLAQDPKQWNDAIGAAQQAVSLNEKSVTAQMAVARIFDTVGDLPHSADAFRAALLADPGYVPALVGLVQSQARQGKYEEALAEARKLVAARPNSASANLLLGTMLARREQWADSVTALQKATAGGVNTAEAWALLGTALYYARRAPEGVTPYKKAVALEPGNLGYRTTYGLLLGVAGQAEAGIAELQRVVGDPAYKDADAWMNLGWLYRSVEPMKAADAVAAYQKALQFDATNGQALVGLAWAHYYIRNYDAAIETFDKAARADESLKGRAYGGTAWSYLFKKDTAKAEEFRVRAEAAGRIDAKLTENIARVRHGLLAEEKKMDKAEDAPVRAPVVTADSLNYKLYGGSALDKIAAAKQCSKFGTACLDRLIAALAAQDNRQDVRVAAANAIGLMGKAGKKVDGRLREVLESTKCPEVVPSADCQKREASMENLQKAVQAAIRAVNGL